MRRPLSYKLTTAQGHIIQIEWRSAGLEIRVNGIEEVFPYDHVEASEFPSPLQVRSAQEKDR